jgi:antirestriction protein ArdC
MRTDVYDKITNQIVAELEKGVRPWHKPWNREHAAGRITRPLRANGIPYQGINVLMLWSAALDKGYAAPRGAAATRECQHADISAALACEFRADWRNPKSLQRSPHHAP